ncbi:winged helix-turn-helix domain-containing protein [Shouchella lonarensis]|uniref:Regulatory protein, arsR family n=1 Tax=Shouchella lonarensis TaxID=1464122 RepID=A0A1G6GXM2_9BACI|nr:winged helix-turn-helix domain-containing protein [Shouchella lonarensis]SDB85886.1 regulatory protein, arsR family [Shouchella lonarensis]
MLNQTKRKIMDAISEQEKTVKEIAADIDVPASRLYYHMKQLEELKVIVKTKTEQKGNLRENYYMSQSGEMNFTSLDDDDEMKEILPEVIRHVNETVAKAMTLFEEGLYEEETGESRGSLVFLHTPMTYAQWKKANKAIKRVLDEAEAEADATDTESGEEKHDYAYMLLTYKQEG